MSATVFQLEVGCKTVFLHNLVFADDEVSLNIQIILLRESEMGIPNMSR